LANAWYGRPQRPPQQPQGVLKHIGETLAPMHETASPAV